MSELKAVEPVIAESFSELAAKLQELPQAGHKAMIVGDSNTIPLFGEAVQEAVAPVFSSTAVFAFEAGEENKTLLSIQALLAYMIDLHYDRKDLIIAVGGGVVGDMAGFAAAIYLRGIAVVQLPTTLLAQIDSSIGGKTGVDFDGYKNMIGAFKMPSLVYTNSSALESLPDDQFRAGMGEVVKTALLGDPELYDWLFDHADEVLNRDRDAMLEMIRRTAAVKVAVVKRDPTEQGERALLNLGHTIGHAIEKAAFFNMIHGDCVSVGLHAAAEMSYARGYISKEELDRIAELYRLYGLPSEVEGFDPTEILKLTKSDKKMQQGQIRFILIRKPGEAFFTDEMTDEELLAGIRTVVK
ncbi:MAG: 3-dehydroquinate synthase [Lachnospiraceae bacterium]|nr:3-dehydroquinate synthase [Lachnospiraceae bacterium]